MYHGWGKRRSYFEGWYFKVVAPEGKAALAFIPGISIDKQGRSEAFVQVLDGLACHSAYYPFPAENFHPSPRGFELRLGGCFFSRHRMVIDLPAYQGEIRQTGLAPWPSSLGAPGIMGWYSFVPFMECYHGVISMDHRLQGRLSVEGRDVDFDGGRGYMEKDWGRSFPSAWIWAQSNHFGQAGISLMVSVARIPWRGSHFIGFIAGFWWKGRLFRFASYTGARMRARLLEDGARIAFRDKRHTLTITARKGAPGNLIAPIEGLMSGKINESLQATLEVKLHRRGELLFSGKGKQAGLELVGPVEILLTETWRR